ncbi:MAG TPA: hypothetical protein VK895_02810 [Jiangellaceae bacterium]|nr:hypothetical protein [Jiangellaceae bacterium]
MRIRVRSVLIALATAATFALISSGTANAGGPTSVIIVNPATGEANALYHDDADYQILNDALAPAESMSVEQPAQLAHGPGSSAINITWLIHDVEVWRIDYVRIDLKYVWVKTSTNAWPAPYETDGQWHVAAGAEAVIGVLDRLGVLSDELLEKGGWNVTGSGNAAAAPAGDSDAAAAAGDGDAAAAAGAQQPMSSAPPLVPAWQWLAAAASGLAVGATAWPALAYLRRRERGPRQRLLALGAADDSGQPDPNPAKAPALVLDLGDLDPADLPR